jgi:hypothetical protein
MQEDLPRTLSNQDITHASPPLISPLPHSDNFLAKQVVNETHQKVCSTPRRY